MDLKNFKTIQENKLTMFDEREVKTKIKEVFQKYDIKYVPYTLDELGPFTLSTLGLKGGDLKVVWDSVRLLQQRNL